MVTWSVGHSCANSDDLFLKIVATLKRQINCCTLKYPKQLEFQELISTTPGTFPPRSSTNELCECNTKGSKLPVFCFSPTSLDEVSDVLAENNFLFSAETMNS